MASTATPATSKELLVAMREPWIDLRLAAAAIGLDGLEARTSAGWTYQEMLAHVAAWHEATVRRLRALRETGRPAARPELRDADAFNARVAEAAGAKSVEQVLEELDASWQALGAEVEALTEEQIAAHDGWARAVVAANTFDHYAEHRDEIMSAVPRTRRALESKVEEGWRRFRALVAEADLERTIREGWDGKAVVAHAANWLEHLSSELRLRLAGGRGPAPNIQAENDRMIAESRQADPAELVARLEAGHAAVLRTLASVEPEAEVPFLAVRVVAGESYEHFREHLADLERVRR